MSVIEFNEMPDSSRLWVYGAKRGLDEQQIVIATDRMNQFMREWTAHKRDLTTAWELRNSQFFLIAVDESAMAASGCSIDSMVHNLQELEREVGIEIMSTTSKLFYRDSHGGINCLDRLAFKQLIVEETVNAATIVFNNTIQTVGELRGGKWEVPVK